MQEKKLNSQYIEYYSRDKNFAGVSVIGYNVYFPFSHPGFMFLCLVMMCLSY